MAVRHTATQRTASAVQFERKHHAANTGGAEGDASCECKSPGLRLEEYPAARSAPSCLPPRSASPSPTLTRRKKFEMTGVLVRRADTVITTLKPLTPLVDAAPHDRESDGPRLYTEVVSRRKEAGLPELCRMTARS